MTVGDVFVAIGDLIAWTFPLLEMGGNFVNYAFLIGGFVGLGYWVSRQMAYNKEAASTGGWE